MKTFQERDLDLDFGLTSTRFCVLKFVFVLLPLGVGEGGRSISCVVGTTVARSLSVIVTLNMRKISLTPICTAICLFIFLLNTSVWIYIFNYLRYCTLFPGASWQLMYPPEVQVSLVGNHWPYDIHNTAVYL